MKENDKIVWRVEGLTVASGSSENDRIWFSQNIKKIINERRW